MDSVYLETSFIGHLTSRVSANLVVAAHQQVTREWWLQRRSEFRLFVSDQVISEISTGDSEAAEERLRMIAGIAVLLDEPAGPSWRRSILSFCNCRCEPIQMRFTWRLPPCMNWIIC